MDWLPFTTKHYSITLDKGNNNESKYFLSANDLPVTGLSTLYVSTYLILTTTKEKGIIINSEETEE